jgi:hypothetical protein
MRLSEIITEVGYEVDRTGIDDRVKFWIQQAINIVYAALPQEERQRTATLTTVNAQQWLDVPTDFGDVARIYDSSNEEIGIVTPAEFFSKTKLATSGTPSNFIFWNNQILFTPTPSAAVSFSMQYFIEHPNIYTHNLTIDYQAAMGSYVQVYIDEDGVGSGKGKLLFVSPTTTDARILLSTVDGHQHEIIVYHDADAATNGVAWWFDESATNAYERNFFISPTKADTVIKTENYRRHHHYLKFIHNPSPTTYPDASNVEVYLDEDAVDRTLRLAFVSPTTTDGTNELVHTAQGELPGLLERYHPVIFELAVAKGHRFNKNYEWSSQHAKSAAGLMALITGKPSLIEAPETERQ